VKLRTLQWQLNPHFLFNSLNTVSALLKSSPERADQVLAKFSDLLRMTLKEQEQLFNSVNSELEYVHRYLQIELVRFEDRLGLDIEADQRAMDGQVPSLLLQPLIENAIKHGIARIPGRAFISISVVCDDKTLIFVVKNTSSRQYVSTDARTQGLGLKNLRERLSTLYPGTHTFQSNYADSDEWVARVEIPFETYSERPSTPAAWQ
jgi:LytS/YehU family sensor histidine kinase